MTGHQQEYYPRKLVKEGKKNLENIHTSQCVDGRFFFFWTGYGKNVDIQTNNGVRG